MILNSLADVRLVPGVDADVELEVLARGQRLPAHVAQEVALARVRAQVAAQRVDVREVTRAHAAAQRQRAPGCFRVRARAVRQQVAKTIQWSCRSFKIQTIEY